MGKNLLSSVQETRSPTNSQFLLFVVHSTVSDGCYSLRCILLLWFGLDFILHGNFNPFLIQRLVEQLKTATNESNDSLFFCLFIFWWGASSLAPLLSFSLGRRRLRCFQIGDLNISCFCMCLCRGCWWFLFFLVFPSPYVVCLLLTPPLSSLAKTDFCKDSFSFFSLSGQPSNVKNYISWLVDDSAAAVIGFSIILF